MREWFDEWYGVFVLAAAAVAVPAAIAAWAMWLLPLRHYSHDSTKDFVWVLIVSIAITGALVALVFWGRRAREWGSSIALVLLMAALPAALVYADSRRHSVQREGKLDRLGMQVFERYAQRFPYGIADAGIVSYGDSVTRQGRDVMEICGYPNLADGVQQDTQFCAVVDLLANPQVQGGYKVDYNDAGDGMTFFRGQPHDCFGVGQSECDK